MGQNVICTLWSKSQICSAKLLPICWRSIVWCLFLFKWNSFSGNIDNSTMVELLPHFTLWDVDLCQKISAMIFRFLQYFDRVSLGWISNLQKHLSIEPGNRSCWKLERFVTRLLWSSNRIFSMNGYLGFRISVRLKFLNIVTSRGLNSWKFPNIILEKCWPKTFFFEDFDLSPLRVTTGIHSIIQMKL